MRLSAQMTLVVSVIFAVACFAVAINGFTQMGDITDAAQLSDARGFALFWAFLGVIGVVFGWLSWWIVRTHKDERL
jgi:hypothetical protein